MRFRLWLTMAVVLTIAVPGRAADTSCLKCHEKAQTIFANSIHAQAGLTCVNCHTGTPKNTDTTGGRTENCRRPENKQAIAELCATCHSDVRKMNPFGLPTDQLAQYKTSKHGEQLFEKNDQKVAVCTDCHGVHDILKAKSPEARTYATNIPTTCGRCHSDAKLMSQYKLPSDVVDKYKTSYHAYMLFEKSDISAPTCVTCHGNHGAVPPGTKQVSEVCGKCHVRQAELFKKSPHNEPTEAGLFNGCVSCHSNHGIQKASINLFATACIQCHATDKEQLAIRDNIVKLLERANGEYERASALVESATVQGLATEDEQLLLQEAKTQVAQLEVLQHTLSTNELRASAVRTEDVVADVLTGVNALEKVEYWKKRSLWPIWTFLFVMSFLFWLKRRQIERGQR